MSRPEEPRAASPRTGTPVPVALVADNEQLPRWQEALASAGRLQLRWLAYPADIEGPGLFGRAIEGQAALVVALGGRISLRAVERLVAGVGCPVIVLGEEADAELARAAIRTGAADYVAAAGELQALIAMALSREEERRRTASREARLRRELAEARRRLELALEASTTDWLTGLFNRRYMDERLLKEESAALRGGRPLALALLDIDHFKLVNDVHGHLIGDQVLRRVAELVRSCLRTYDIACRFGGEEFALILPSTRLSAAVQVAQRVCQRIAQQPFEVEGLRLRVTVSLGVGGLPGSGVTSAPELLRAAFDALRRAKEEGRNRVAAAADLIGDSGPFEAEALPEGARQRIDRLRRSILDLRQEAVETHFKAAVSLVRLVESDQNFVFGRSEEVARIAGGIGRRLGLAGQVVDTIERAALFQDLGMIALGPEVARASSLSADERQLVKRHPALSVQIAEGVDFLHDTLPLILDHHERLDGSGYPRGVAGGRIPVGARVLAVATALEAMTTGRPYRPPRPVPEALDELETRAGTWYDPEVVRAAAELEEQEAGGG